MPRSAAALALVVAATLVGACGSDSSTPNADTNTNATASTNDDTGGSTPAEGRAAAGRGVRLVKVGDFQAPVYVTAPPCDRRRIFVVEQAGRIMIVRGGKPVAQPFLDIRPKVTAGGEQGLLSMAFAPDYAQSGLFYVYYTEKSGTESIWEYHRAGDDSADPNSARLVLRMADPEPNHNGGLMIFGSDKLMYVGTGDGGGGNDQHGARGNAQSLSSPLGKILRIDPRSSGGKPYTIPSSNPFVGRSGARGEIYAYGLRNPWRFSFDRRTGDMIIADVGQNAVEEIDFRRRGTAKGVNFGWRPWEGRRRNFDEPAPGAVFPQLQKLRSGGWCSIIGGYVVRDRALGSLYGRYLYSDNCKGEIRSVKLSQTRARGDRDAGLSKVAAPSSFGEDARGHVYVASLAGPVYRLAP
jgi:glucose/arabinose dehydrogenase